MILLTNKYDTILPTSPEADMVRDKKVRVVYVRIRAARLVIKPSLVLPITRAIADGLNIESGQTSAIFIESDKSFRIVRTKP